MARAHFVKSARKPIYQYGKEVSKIHQKGKNKGEEYKDTDKSQPQDKDDKILVKVGEPYYWWQFRFGPKHISKGKPKASQLTQSSFYSTLYSIQESMEGRLSGLNTEDMVSLELDSIASEIRELQEECQDSLENMPESLQSSPTGELLQERIDALEEWAEEIEGMDVTIDEELNEEDKKSKIEDIINDIQCSEPSI